MSDERVVNVDLADVWASSGRKDYLRSIAWGDEVVVTEATATYYKIETVSYEEREDGSVLPVRQEAYIEPRKGSGVELADILKPKKDNEVLKVNFVDVQQGDGAVIESPEGQIILVDGGDNQMFARYLAGRFRGTSVEKPKDIDCIIVTHGDADHFSGLAEIFKSEKNKEARKRLFIAPKRYYHNGIVKRPATMNGVKLGELDLLGPTSVSKGKTYLTGLVTDLLKVPEGELNAPFEKWRKALAAYDGREPIEFRRLEFGDRAAFKFFNRPGLRIEVLGPLGSTVGEEAALRFFNKPPAGPRPGEEAPGEEDAGSGSPSASHTINGNSIVFRLTYGAFSYLFTGDLNEEAGRYLTAQSEAGKLELKSEVFKVPHHGSADFSGALLKAVSPLVSVVSSGDESSRKEYIHPRATLMGALGKWSRVDEPLIFVTELVAFMKVEGKSLLSDAKKAAERGEFFGFSRACYGIVKTRTDGKRLFVYTDSGNVKMKEAYAYEMDAKGVPRPVEVVRV